MSIRIDEAGDYTEEAIRKGLITPLERHQIMNAFEAGLRGYTYFER